MYISYCSEILTDVDRPTSCSEIHLRVLTRPNTNKMATISVKGSVSAVQVKSVSHHAPVAFVTYTTFHLPPGRSLTAHRADVGVRVFWFGLQEPREPRGG